MNIYLATRSADYDEFYGFVVIAESEESARNLIKEEHCSTMRYLSEFEIEFVDEYTGSEKKEFILMDSYHAG